MLGGIPARASEGDGELEELEELRESMQALREDVAGARVRNRQEVAGMAPAAQPVAATPDGVPAEEPMPPSPEEMRARSDYEGRHWIRVFEEAVSVGPRDTRLPGDMRATLMAADTEGELTVEEIDCNAELCSVHIAHRDPEAAKRILRSLWTQENFRGPAFIRRERAGETFESTWVVARDGLDLPPVPNDPDDFRLE